MAKIHLGCSGWSYKDWIKTFYPPRIKNNQMLDFYTKVFKTCEINTTFYQIPKKKFVANWAEKVPENFVFAVKFYKRFTHELLKDKSISQQEIDFYFDQISPLMPRMGPVLIQFPPSLKYDLETLTYLISFLPTKHRYVMEFRHISWLKHQQATLKILEKHDIAYCIVDEPHDVHDNLLPPDLFVTTDFCYIRWHGLNPNHWYDYLYSEEQLKKWAQKIESLSENVSEIYGYFNNHLNGQAPTNCLQLLQLLGKKVTNPKKISLRPKGQTSLGRFL
ncbi:MAG: DUF72 domain-containing protein [Candidatus Helarchaeota archaeon]